jgi:hypothetical protein
MGTTVRAATSLQSELNRPERNENARGFLHNPLHNSDPTQPDNRDFTHPSGRYPTEKTWYIN